MVSVIIPAYNCEEYISQCIDSLLNQKEPSIEIIIIDDGSQDKTAMILDDYARRENCIKVFHTPNGGPSRARNFGLKKAAGEWVIFVDADDWVDADILTRLELNEQSPDITYFGFKKCLSEGQVEECVPPAAKYIADKNAVNQELSTLFESVDAYFGFSWNKIFKRSIIKSNNINFKDGLHIREDEIFTLDYCRYITSIQTVAFAPYNYRILDNSLSHDKSVKYRNYRLLIECENEILKSYEQSDFKAAVLRRIFNYHIAAIVECIKFDSADKMKEVIDAVTFFQENRLYVSVPLWQRLMFGFPIKPLRKYLVYTVFSLRNKFL